MSLELEPAGKVSGKCQGGSATGLKSLRQEAHSMDRVEGEWICVRNHKTDKKRGDCRLLQAKFLLSPIGSKMILKISEQGNS